MMFVQRENGTVVGVFRNRQPGLAEEELPDDHEDVTGYLAPAPTFAQQQAVFERAIQATLDAFARSRNYDGILSACTYVTSAVPAFAAEAQCCVALRDATWQAAYTLLAAVQAGQRPVPSIAEVLAEMPALAWPQ